MRAVSDPMRHLKSPLTTVALLSFFLASLIAGPAAYAGTEAGLAHACSLLQMRDWPEARKAFLDVLNSDVRCAEASAGVATCDLYAGDVQSAQKRFAELLALSPACAPAHAGLALAAYRSGDADTAIREFRLAAAADPGQSGTYRATIACLEACTGLYQAAANDASAALVLDPTDALAIYVRAACLYASGRAQDALAALPMPPSSGQFRCGIDAQSCLFAPGTRYFADRNLGDDVRLARIGQGALSLAALPTGQAGRENTGEPAAATPEAAPPPGQATGEAGITVISPRTGAVVRGAVEVAVEEGDQARIDYIAVLLDQEFIGISNARPFRVNCDTRHVSDGMREIRVDAYGPDGTVVAHASVNVAVQNGNRTLADSEQSARAAAARVIGRMLVLEADPLLQYQLAGACLRAIGRLPEAASAFETGFSFAPDIPGLRTDLLTTYADMGLLQHLRSHELHALPVRAGRSVALTFDDGPHPIITPFILDLLDRYQAKATFFLVGKQVELYPDLAREIVRRGHVVGIHGYTHTDLRRLSQLGVERELIKARAAVRDACGFRPVLFRPPGGDYNQSVRQATVACGLVAVFWTADITYYPGASSSAIASALLNRAKDGGIILLHNGEDQTPEVLPILLPALLAKGCRLDTLYALTDIQPWSGVQ